MEEWKYYRLDIIQISKTLDKMLKDVRQVIYSMMEERNIDLAAIPDRLQKQNEATLTFIDFCNQRATIRRYGKKKDTQERYNRFIRLFTARGMS